MEVKFFISAVSSEFDVYRESIRRALTRTNVSVKIQEDFKAGGVPTLIKLDDYIKDCDAVVHLVGDACGADASAQALLALVERYPDLAAKVPGLSGYIVGPNAKPLTYTQWEAWLAMYHRKRLFIAKALDTAPRSDRHAHDSAEAARQALHLKALEQAKAYAEINFDSVDNLGVQLLGSPVLDLLLSASLSERLKADKQAQEEFLKQDKRSGLKVPLFRYLWDELGNPADLLAPLAEAVLTRKVDQLVQSLSEKDSDSPEAALLRSAWSRVQLVLDWEPRAEALGLPLSRWRDVTAVVADTDARTTPRFAGLRDVLLWAVNLGELARAQATLTQLLWLGSEAGRRDGAQAEADTLLALIEADTALQPHLTKARAGPPPPTLPVRLYVELELPAGQATPSIQRHWVELHHWPVLGTAEAAGSLAEQLQALASSLEDRLGTRKLHVELMAPLMLLCPQSDWMSYSVDVSHLYDEPGATLTKDFGDDFVVTWRWRQRLQDLPESNAKGWQERAPKVIAKADQCAALVCHFADEQPSPADVHVVGLHFLPPTLSNKQRNREQFLRTLQRGDPYLLWHCDEAVACNDFKASVRQHIVDKHITELPEALRAARHEGQLKDAVLFVDEPTRNPYKPMGQAKASFTTPEAPSN